MSDVTRILNAIEGGDTRAVGKLLPLVYEELRLLATRKLSQEKPDQTLQATALVHEAYIRLVEATDQGWHSRGHLFRAVAAVMRRILVENAHAKKSVKQGEDCRRTELLESDLPIRGHIDEIIALGEALTTLSDSNRVAVIQ